MLRLTATVLTLLIAAAGAARAEGERAGDHDYYVLSLSWSPSWCAAEGDARDAPQCDTDAGWTLHGLWPQYETGWPSWCRTDARDPSRRETGDMADIMGSGGLAWYQWKKHGRCAGLDPADYFALSRQAYDGVARPDLLRRLDREVEIAPSVIEDAFLETNPDLTADMLTITCDRGGRIAEARLCLTRDLEPRICGADVIRDCGAAAASFPPVRD